MELSTDRNRILSFYSDVHRGLNQDEFEIYVQFIVDAISGKIIGGEALTRWLHPTKGLLLPDLFVPQLEAEGKICQIDYSTLEKACAFLSELYASGVDQFFISCNFSRTTFSAEDFVEKCLAVTERYPFPSRMLVFELTESASGGSSTHILRNAIRIKELGFRIALDDFGERFTSFFDLQEYPIDVLKVDKRLIDNLHTEKGVAIFRGMTQVCHEIGLQILAEGVEREEQVCVLRELKCDIIQGFHFHYPVPAHFAMKKLLA